MRTSRLTIATALATSALLLACFPAAGSEPDGWELSGALYIWGADLGLETVGGQSVDAEFEDVLDNLELAFMGTLGGRRGMWSWYGDLVFVAVDARDTIPVEVPGFMGGPIDARVQLEQDLWVLTGGVGYSLSESAKHRSDFIFGARYIDVETEVTVDLGIEPAIELDDSGNNLDGFVGLKGRRYLNDSWYFGYYADIGTGQSDLTWQVLADVNYEFNRIDLGIGYRWAEWRLDGDDLLDELEISGPYAGILFRFR